MDAKHTSTLTGSEDDEIYLNLDDFSNGEGDYINLPQFGAQYFSLEHAALLMALDVWAQNNVEDDPDFYELVACAEARKASQTLAKKLEAALTQAVMTRELVAVVCSKSLPLGKPLPSRTYAHAEAIRKWAEPYGLGNGHLMEYADSLDDEAYDLALSVSRRRYLIAEGLMPARYEVNDIDPMPSHLLVDELTKKIEAKNLQIAYLEKKLAAQNGDTKPLGAKQKNNLLRLVSALQTLLMPAYQDKQDALIADIERRFPRVEGLSKRNLEAVFPQARRMLNSD